VLVEYADWGGKQCIHVYSFLAIIYRNM